MSEQIEARAFSLSFLMQPDLYLRIRPGRQEKVLGQLREADIDFGLVDDSCVQLANQIKVDEVLYLDADAVVQDRNSQQVLQPLTEVLQDQKIHMWDCCAASGGKSILFHDQYPSSHITVSDVRQSILINLHNRFKRAGIKNYNAFVADVSSDDFSLQKKFDVVLCDAPCSGSGTWSRTPEQLYFFTFEKIDHYAKLQKKIALHAAAQLKDKGFFLYITCSVFRKENEEVVAFIQKNSGLQLTSMQYYKGYEQKADTLFVALFSKL